MINQMLKDLDRRQQEAEGAAVYVAPVRQQGWWMLVLTLLYPGPWGSGWRTWIFWQQSQRASLPAAQVEAPRTALRWRHPRPWRWWPPRRRSPAAPVAKVPAASAESTAARVAPPQPSRLRPMRPCSPMRAIRRKRWGRDDPERRGAAAGPLCRAGRGAERRRGACGPAAPRKPGDP